MHPLPFPELIEPLRILIVDDQELDRAIISARLVEVAPGHTIITEASSAGEALDAVAHAVHPFDCVLLDMNMPDYNGMDASSIVLGIKPKQAIVMITAETGMDKALTCLKAGAEDFLVKGEYTNLGLYRAIRYAVARHRAAVEHARLSEALTREQTLIAAQKEFIHLVSHEFRTPITIISGAAQLLAAKAPALHQGEGFPQFKKIRDALKRLEGLLDNVLRLSMVEEGKQVFSPAMFAMEEAIAEVVDYFGDARITYDLGRQPVQFFGDRRLVEYALHNVISNAVKFSPSGSAVHVTLRTLKAGLEICVRDKGRGMSPATIARAGEKFYRDSDIAHIGGTGLGVHLAQRFIEYHQGTLFFCSELGQGTTVRLFLPYMQGMEKAA